MITENEKRRHPQYQEYIENFEAVLTGLEAGMRGIGAPDLIAEKCLETALSFYDADSAALVESNRELSYGVCVTELCKPGVKSYQGRIINITAEDTPYLYNKIMSNEGFDLSYPEDKEDLSFYESMLMEKMGIEILAVAPYDKRTSGYLYIRNPKRFAGLYGMLQALSYVCASERNEFKLMDSLNINNGSKLCHSDTDVVIKVFGALTITTRFGTLTEAEITSALAVRLVAYLLFNDTRRVSQRELVDALWPDATVDAPSKQVKNVVHRTRNILSPIFPDNLVISDKMGNYYINPNVNVVTDASVFESLCRNGMLPSSTRKEKIHFLRQAIKLYDHEFLPNYYGVSWLDNQRTYYHLSYIKVVLEILPMLYEESAFSDMYSISSAALLVEPDNGDIQFWHIRAMIALGGYEIAQKHFSQHSQSLSDEQKKLLAGLFAEIH